MDLSHACTSIINKQVLTLASSTELAIHMSARPTWAEVNLAALQRNFRAVKTFLAPEATICCVVKCDAYGHGSVECSRALQEAGATWFGVTSTEEAVKLRRGYVTTRILVMTGFWRGEEEEILESNLTPAIWSAEHVHLLRAAAERRPKRRVPVHIKVDTGMSRLGVQIPELPKLIEALKAAEDLEVEGVFSHLASSENLNAESAREQIARFEEVRKIFREHGTTPKYEHLANSAAVAGRRETWHNMVRPGLLLYGGCLPLEANGAKPEMPIELTPVLSWKTRVIALKDLPAGQAIGYGGNYVTKAPMRIAVIPVGYGDGFSRHLSSKGRVIIRDRYAPIVGNVSMDLVTVDVTDIPGTSIGDEVVLIGRTEHCQIDVEEHAMHTETIPYEILCGLSPRVPRKYVDEV
jgi:alanine racemase